MFTTSSRAVQPANAVLATVNTLQLERSTFLSEVQSMNASVEMSVSEDSFTSSLSWLTKYISLRFVQPQNALSSIVVTPLGMMITSTFLLSLNASVPMEIIALSEGISSTLTPSMSSPPQPLYLVRVPLSIS